MVLSMRTKFKVAWDMFQADLVFQLFQEVRLEFGGQF